MGEGIKRNGLVAREKYQSAANDVSASLISTW
jgi:hypothetical protein